MKPTATHLANPAVPPPVAEYAEAPVWLQRLFAFTYVMFCIVLGVWLVVFPWTNKWFADGLVSRWPGLQQLLQQGFVRGAVSGLGLVDIWLGVWEAVHYRDRAPAHHPASSLTDGNLHGQP